MNKIGNQPIITAHNIDDNRVFAFSTLSYSQKKSFDYKGSNPQNLRRNLSADLKLPNLVWLSMSHGTDIISIPGFDTESGDGAVVSAPGFCAAITTADCLPVVIYRNSPLSIAVLHCGWRGLAGGIIEKYFREYGRSDLPLASSHKVWIGPGVRNDYEVGTEVADEIRQSGNVDESSFVPLGSGKYLACLHEIAASKLIACGIKPGQIAVSQESTISAENHFSVRREGMGTGRFATCVGIY